MKKKKERKKSNPILDLELSGRKSGGRCGYILFLSHINFSIINNAFVDTMVLEKTLESPLDCKEIPTSPS